MVGKAASMRAVLVMMLGSWRSDTWSEQLGGEVRPDGPDDSNTDVAEKQQG